MKAVSLIIQFVIFFTIGLGFFLFAGNLFRFQSNLIKSDILDTGLGLSASQLSAASIKAIDSCKSCDNVTIELSPQNIAGYNPIYQLANGVVLEVEPENKVAQYSMHNIYYSITYGGAKISSSKPIFLTYDRTKNNLVIT